MARPLRLSFENAVYHITSRGNRRENIFYSDKDKKVFIEKMSETFWFKAKHNIVGVVFLGMDNPLEKSYKGIALCNEAFIEKIKGKIKSFGKKREISETKIAGTHTVEEIIKKIVDKLAIEKDEILCKRKGNIYCQMSLYLIKKYSTLSLKTIGKLFDMDYSTVSQACKKFEKRMQKDKNSLSEIKTINRRRFEKE